MANVLDPLIPTLTASLNSVVREATPINMVIDTSYGVQAAALNQTVPVVSSSPVAGQDITPGATHPGSVDVQASSIQVGITKRRFYAFNLSGEEMAAMGANAGQYQSLQMQEAFRAGINELWDDIAALHAQAGYAFGTPGTNPFASNLDAISDIGQILDESSAPTQGRFLVLDPTTKSTAAKLGALQEVAKAGSSETLRDGVITRLGGYNIGWANSIKLHTKGTGTGYQINKSGGYAIGATSLIVDTGSNTIVAGDIITGAGDSNKYIVASFSGGVITLNSGLKQAWADDTAITIANSSRRMLFGHRSAIAFGIRPPHMGDDMAKDRVLVSDPLTGLTFSVAYYPQFGRGTFQAELAWGGKIIRNAWCGSLIR